MQQLHGGDKVRVRSDLKAGDVFYYLDDGDDRSITVTRGMERFCGKVCTIDDVLLGGQIYWLDEDLNGNFWSAEMFEAVDDTPDHYRIDGLKQPSIDVIKAIVEHNGLSGWAAFCLGNALKYLFRFGRKGGVKDLKKAMDYIKWLMEVVGEYDQR